MPHIYHVFINGKKIGGVFGRVKTEFYAKKLALCKGPEAGEREAE